MLVLVSMVGLVFVLMVAISRCMRLPRPQHEKDFTERVLGPAKAALRKDRVLRGQIYIYAVQNCGADPVLFPGRLAHVLRDRDPDAYVALVIDQWWNSLDPAARSSAKK